jgi:hypothetical protein
MKRYASIWTLLAGLALLLLLFPSGHHCVARLDAYFTVGFAIVMVSWVVAFRLLRAYAVLSRLLRTLGFALGTLLIWVLILPSREFYLLCW